MKIIIAITPAAVAAAVALLSDAPSKWVISVMVLATVLSAGLTYFTLTRRVRVRDVSQPTSSGQVVVDSQMVGTFRTTENVNSMVIGSMDVAGIVVSGVTGRTVERQEDVDDNS